jgi:hypothetical protein
MAPDLQAMLPEAARATEHFGIAYGLGVDSTAILVELVRLGIRPDFILFTYASRHRRGRECGGWRRAARRAP